jgi:hypothetical protein
MSESGEKPCVRCGEPTRERLGAVAVCRACYDIRSSCCQEFGADDLTCLPDATKPDADGETVQNG